MGSQGLDIVSLMKPITKYAVMIENPQKIKYELQKAIHIAKTGRPGPVWIDIPLNFQWLDIEPDNFVDFNPKELEKEKILDKTISKPITECIEMLKIAKRPLILAGYGIRLSHAEYEFREFIEKFKIPFISSWTASDILPTNHKFYVGRSGIAGQRGANFAVQNCDLLLSVGSHLSIPLTGNNFESYAREAKKIIVDIDPIELDFETVKIDLSIQCDAKKFLSEIVNQTNECKNTEWWLKKCSEYKTYNEVPLEWFKQKEYVNPYVFIDILSNKLKNDDVIVVDGGGTVVYNSFQAFKVKENQRLIESSGIGAMGTGLPESIGACFANDCKRTICLCGDGSLQLNIQEMQTIKHHNLPIKIFVFNNKGYSAIRHTQDEFLEANHVGSDIKGGLSLPDFMKVAKAYGIEAIKIKNHQELEEKLSYVLGKKCPMLCDINISENQEVIPHQGFYKKLDGLFASNPLEDMYPFLNRKEFLENMIIPVYKENIQ